jgi:hypothetical protein
MLDRARFLVVSEVSEALQQGQIVIETRVDRALDRSLTTKSRVDGKVKTAKVLPVAAPPVARRAARAS